jgi:glutamate N-acetyltransferase / amino-acid N-acetyltransferase
VTATAPAVDTNAGVTAAQGFRAAGVAAGLKSTGALDLALVVNDGPLDAAAGVFTRNKVKAAPVLWSREVLTHGRLRAVVLNSGGANACTGPDGFADTHATAEHVGAALSVGAIDVAVCSTGLIGEPLPMPALLSAIPGAVSALAATHQAGLAAARAVMTTDTVPKQAALHHPDGWTVGGFAKGAGMIAPSLATMLAVLTTDAVADSSTADRALRGAVSRTFERLDIDGCCSTNDTVLLLASGASGKPAAVDQLTDAVTRVCAELARQLQADAEGVTKCVAITVAGAASEPDALAVARQVARDSLVKTALFGSDPNWGRIVAAVGMADAQVDPDLIEVAINGVLLCRNGYAAGDRSTADLSGPDISVHIGLGRGGHEATVLTTDLSHGYVEENSAYSS